MKLTMMALLISIMIFPVYSNDSNLMATVQLVQEGLDAIEDMRAPSSGCSAGVEMARPCLARDGGRSECSSAEVEKCSSYRFYYDQNSSCGGSGDGMLGFLDGAGRTYDDKEAELRQLTLANNYRPTKEFKLFEGDIIQVEPNPNREKRQTNVNIFIPMERFECRPVLVEECNISNRRYAQYVNGSMNDKRASFPQYPCGGDIIYYLPNSEPIVDDWKGAASTYHERCTKASAYFTSGMQQVVDGKALHPLGICLNFLTESDTRPHSRNDRSDPTNPAELDFCYNQGSIGNEIDCVGELPPVAQKVEAQPTLLPTPTMKLKDFALFENDCCSGGYSGAMLCTNYMVEGFSSFSFHMVECTGDGSWGKTIVGQPCGNPAHACCDVEKYSDWRFAQRCIDILRKK